MVVGFISGAGVLIIFGQLDHIFGIEVHSGSNALGGVIELFRRIAETDPATLVIGVATTVMIYTFHHMRRLKNIATLVAFAVVTPMVLIFNWSTVALVRDQSPIPAGLPLPMLPDLGYAQPLLGAAFATALLACVQHAALVEKLRDRKEPRANINRDFVAHSISNAVGSVFQALPSSGSLSRTAVNISSGAQSRMANVYAGATIFLMMLLFSGVIEVIPLAALAGHLVVAALSLIDLRAIRMVWAVSAIARASMVATFAGALVLPLEYSIYGGVLLSLGLYIWSSSTRIEVIQLVQDERGRFSEQPCPAKLPDRTPVVLSVHGTLYFAAFRKLETLLPDPEGSIKPVVILRLRDTESLGSTGINVILRYDAALRDQGGKLILAGVGKKLRDELTRTGALMRIGPDAVFDAQPVIFQSTESATDYAAELSGSDADSA
ncbi:MAG: SulP family inorganic anion transporter [Chloroflexi bacterium]|nr:SulP family inorganic anion transporter [Chloroflexota bacterium]